MALLGPFFLLGLLCVGLPIWLHRLETQITEREKFSTTRFLEPAKKRIHVQKKLKYLLLMALRILFFIILVLAFTRPVLFTDPQAVVTEDTTHHVIVLDTSFSMSADDLFDAAIDAARSIINDMGSDDIASIYSASSEITTITGASANREALNDALGGVASGYGKLDLGVMVSSLNTLIEESQANFILHVISDFQQSGQAVRFADMIPDVINGRPVTLDVVRLATDNTPNWAVDSVLVSNRDSVTAGIRGYAGAEDNVVRTLVIAVNGEVQAERSLSLEGTGIQFVEVDGIEFAEGDNRIDVTLTPADALAGDDRRHNVFDNSPPAPVLLLTGDSESLGVTYITAALETAPRGYEVITQSVNDLDVRILQRYPWLVVEDIGVVNTSLATALAEYVNAGGAILAGAGEASLNLPAIPVLDIPVTASSLRRESRMPITMIDGSHPALSDTSGWDNVNIQSIPVAAARDDSILIAQSGNRPVLIERNMGRGRFMLLTTALDNSISDLPVKPVFVSFMAEAAQHLSNENLLVREQVADSYLQLSRAGGASGQVFDPDGNSLLSLTDTTRSQDVKLNKIGYYQVFTPGGEVLIAVNPDRRESDLTIMDAQVLQNWQNTVAGAAGSGGATPATTGSAAAEDTEELEVWRLFLILLALIVLAESVLGNQHLRVRTGNL